MTYEQCVDYLFKLHRFGIRLGLQTMQDLCRELGNPEQTLKFIHIAGTNGKGSTAAFLESILREEGYLTGLYTSPHLVEMGERIRVAGNAISKGDIVRLTLRIKDLVETKEALKDVSFFEFLTAMALLYFKEQKVQIVVWETGLGGRLDATNVVDPECCVITGIGYDHMEYLGTSLSEIASEKAGILKAGRPLVLGVLAEEAEEVIRAKARGLDCPVSFSPEARSSLSTEIEMPAGKFSFNARGQKWSLGLKGTYQVRNALLALDVCEALEERGFKVSDLAKKQGLEKTRWPGRFDILATEPPVVLDGAHNEQGLKSVLASWKAWFQGPPQQIIFGCVADKNLEAMAALLHETGTVRLVELSTSRSQSIDRMKKAFHNPRVLGYASLPAAVAASIAYGQSTLIVGSLYLAGEYLAFINNDPNELKLNG